ncbi:MAG TPA: NAD(P)/FAD-dependent oxidoreductase [Actinomycetota bacterium]|nr:NAD(P)/FAD-dependent oxidoreductase [Actinomycetota bacterium]
MDGTGSERFETVVIGAGQAGLSAGYYLKRAGRSFVILDANAEVGGSWLDRYDSLQLFTPRWAVRLPGWRFRNTDVRYPSRAQMVTFLREYAERYDMPVRTGVRVERISRDGDGYLVSTDAGMIEADDVIVATGANRDPRVPAFSRELDPSIVQLHSSEYRNPSQLTGGGVLVVGAGNSGADISLDVVGEHPTWLSGPQRGHIPVSIDTWFAQNVVFRLIRFFGVHVLTLRTPIGRRSKAKHASMGDPLVRVKPKQLLAAGVGRVPRTIGVRDGWPVLEDGTVLDVSNVVWATGFRHDFSWIDLPVFGEDGELMHERGVVPSQPGLYFVGLVFQYSAGSDVIPGVPRDARYVVDHLLARERAGSPSADLASAA